MDDTRGHECLWTDPGNHPRCPHGPTLLFSKYIEGNLQKFYACSACRDRKLCNFYLKHGEKLSKQSKTSWEQEIKKFVSQYHHQKLYIRFNELMAQSPDTRCYCHDCERLIFASEKNKHKAHKVTENLTAHQMTHPTAILKPLENAKKEAQYLFSKKSTVDITNMLVKLGAKQVLCIGAPRIFEYINENLGEKMSSLLLDFDGRFHNFFGPLNFCWYNLFNHHFFNENAADVFKDFMTQNHGKDTYLVADPPFGGRVEAMSWTIKKISDLHKKWNNVQDEKDTLKLFFIFPYFMEPILKKKSNPPSISGGLRDLQMSDYKVDYDNHPLYIIDRKENQQPSPARIFTNIPLSKLKLPRADGYRYCKKCERWVAKENKHCKQCNECTSKDGKTYKHCNKCAKCVKPNWAHCKKCNRCLLESHKCGEKLKITGKCYKCNEYGHGQNDCPTNNKEEGKVETVKQAKKRKAETEKSKPKRQKLTETTESVVVTKEAPVTKTNLRKKKKKEMTPRLKQQKPNDTAKPATTAANKVPVIKNKLRKKNKKETILPKVKPKSMKQNKKKVHQPIKRNSKKKQSKA